MWLESLQGKRLTLHHFYNFCEICAANLSQSPEFIESWNSNQYAYLMCTWRLRRLCEWCMKRQVSLTRTHLVLACPRWQRSRWWSRSGTLESDRGKRRKPIGTCWAALGLGTLFYRGLPLLDQCRPWSCTLSRRSSSSFSVMFPIFN